VFHLLDVNSDESVQNIVAWIESDYGHIDVLVNNAAFKGTEYNEENAKMTIGVNCFGVIRICEHLLPLMNKNGRIINVSSNRGIIDNTYSEEMKRRLFSNTIDPQTIVGIYEEFLQSLRNNTEEINGFPKHIYKVSKGLMNAYSRFLFREYGEKVFIATVDPGWVKTRMGGIEAPLTPEEGSDTIVWLSTHDISQLVNGEFWKERKLTRWMT